MPELLMPKMGDAMEEGTILRWLKKEGERIEPEDLVAEIQTDKATIEIPATDGGTLTSILIKEGETVAVGTPIAVLDGAAGGAAKSAAPAAAAAPQAKAAPGREQTPDSDAPSPRALEQDHGGRHAQASAGGPAAGGSRVKSSPLARKVAEEHGIDIAALTGTGPGGRIIEADVEDALRRAPSTAPAAPAAPAAASAPAAEGGAERRMSPMRKAIARRLTESKQSIPHFYLSIDVDMRASWALRSQYNAAAGEERKISFNDMVVRACALALESHPALRSRLDGDVVRTPDTVNIGVAVSLEEGLIVPVVRDAGPKGISGLGREIRRLAERARKGELKPEEYSGGSFTVSNLGMYDITLFQAVINPPEAAILAVGAIRDAAIVENGQVVPGKQMTLTLSVDHRVVDGQVAALFLQDVKKLLQNPMGLLG
jgi:pyruvate dehydrogenase E2 component (dihydrolipoamide acetyltransferase)